LTDGLSQDFCRLCIVGDWYKKAMADGVVSLKELIQLGILLGGVIGLVIAPDVLKLVEEVAEDTLDAIDGAVDTVREVIDDIEEEALEGQEAVVAEGLEANLIAETTNQ